MSSLISNVLFVFMQALAIHIIVQNKVGSNENAKLKLTTLTPFHKILAMPLLCTHILISNDKKRFACADAS